jgi:uncharacterized Zn finger protein
MPRRGWDDRWQRYPASRPLPGGGISTSKQRGAMARTWWSHRFVEVLESFGLGARMQRGRRYARTGQVLDIDVSAGLMVSQVQGSRSRPYLVRIQWATPTRAQWRKIDDAMASRVGFAAKLLAGDMPEELEAVFAAVRTELLPTTWRSLDANCSCPDWESPCKHVAAVLYVFGDQLDTDPWMLLEWRGRTRAVIIDALRARAGAATKAASEEAEPLAPWWPFGAREDVAAIAASALFDVSDFDVAEPADPPDAVLDRCGPLGVDVADEPVSNLLRPAYDAMSPTWS